MIAPIQPGHPADDRPLRDLALPFFRPQGALGAAPAGDFRYEARPQQVDMAGAIADALDGEAALIVEAGTGVGKSLAYLVPLILHAKRCGRRAMVSTHTIELHEHVGG